MHDVKIQLVGSSIGTTATRQHLTTYVINDSVAIDAGCLGLMVPVTAQRSVRHVLLSHTHIDHLATLPLFLDNVFQPGGDCPQVHASGDVWSCLTTDVFNERLWPDLARVATEESSFYTPREMNSESPFAVAGLHITPVSVDHVVPTLGFLIEDDCSAIIIASDTGPTERIWELASQTPFRHKLRAVFLECSFPDSHEWLARKTAHLCPRLFAAEIAKLKPTPPFLTVAVHLKAGMHDAIVAELRQLSLPRFCLGEDGRVWDFSDGPTDATIGSDGSGGHDE